jgi:hypothetical protein
MTGYKILAHNFAAQTQQAQIGWENSASPAVKKIHSVSPLEKL